MNAFKAVEQVIHIATRLIPPLHSAFAAVPRSVSSTSHNIVVAGSREVRVHILPSY